MKITFNVVLNALLLLVVALLVGRYFYFQPRFINGERAPAFRAELLNGADFRLEDLRGRYVLIDFWGSWCPPCRKANPELVELHRRFHDRGFDIVSVGIERDAQQWRRAIERDGLYWKYHILDRTTSMKFFDSELAALYGVKQLPTSYLLNEEGVIVGVNLSAEEIAALLSEAGG